MGIKGIPFMRLKSIRVYSLLAGLWLAPVAGWSSSLAFRRQGTNCSFMTAEPTWIG